MFTSAHLEMVCPACRKAHRDDWKAEFWKHKHYKTRICECGYKIVISTKSMHSGHY